MPSYCPDCGAASPDEARFCMSCGCERQLAPPGHPPTVVVHPPPPPPGHALGPAAPSPPGRFPGRAFRGDRAVAGSGRAGPDSAAPGAGRRRALVWSATLAAAVLVGGGATAGALLLQGSHGKQENTAGQDDSRAAASPEPAPSRPAAAPATSDVTPEVPQTDTPPVSDVPVVPEGYRAVIDPAGFSFAVPGLWSRTGEKNHQTEYAGRTGMAKLLVGVTANVPYTSYENFRSIERTARANQEDYRRIRLARNIFRGRPGAIWEYTYADRDTGGTIHSIDQSYIDAGGTEYAIYTTDHDTQWQQARERFDTALSTWAVPGMD
ncbi:zinc ribbon domain-containing protein [Streptomyces sp. NBC_00344]|uniref:zinc ribbon domain-containing protein n=1 Tax=Streptomyces sp. NBC_00344 TaxID=2975720 RepID=UPI002E2186EE